jgi:polyisoprenoid-binding protein YceI
MSTTETTTAPQTRTFEGVEIPTAGRYVIDASHTNVGFSAKHLMVSKVRGRFSDFDGAVTIADAPLDSSVEVTLQAASIDSRSEDRDGHLRSPDFLDVEQFPTLAFRSTAVRHTGGNEFAVDGELTIKGVSRPLTLEMTFEGVARDPWGGSRIGFSAETEIDREDWGLTWNVALETGGVLVSKKVKLEIEGEAVLEA